MKEFVPPRSPLRGVDPGRTKHVWGRDFHFTLGESPGVLTGPGDRTSQRWTGGVGPQENRDSSKNRYEGDPNPRSVGTETKVREK